MLKTKQIFLCMEENTDWLSNIIWSTVNTYIQVTSYWLNRLYLGTFNTYVYEFTYMYVTTVDEIVDETVDEMTWIWKRQKGI